MNTIYSMFEKQVEQAPFATAIIDGETSITYQELNFKANQLAHYLQKQGIEPDMRVALCFERSIHMFIVILGILKAGAAYVPLDFSHPKERLSFCLADNENPILILPSYLQDKFQDYSGKRIIFDLEEEAIIKEKDDNLAQTAQPNHLAYVIYTSGSTGAPKGVLIEHQSVINYSNWVTSYCNYKPGKRIDFSANYVFDMAITMTIIPLMQGLTIVISSDETKKIAGTYLRYLAAQKINLIKITPSYFKLLVHEIKNQSIPLPNLETIILGGENLTHNECIDWLKWYPKHSLHNEYGPTEVTVAVSQFTVNKKNVSSLGINVPIGQPGPGMNWYILDETLQPVTVGTAGELYVGGLGLARGYLNQTQMTQQKFIELNQQRLYKTGDICRQDIEGHVEYLGRIDSQIKIRGFRVEIQEIEEKLLAYDAVEDVRIVVEEQKNGEKRLLAYLIFQDPTHTLQAMEIRTYLSSQLPAHMIPAIFIKVSHFPLTANGKLDVKALPTPNTLQDKTYKAPATRLEKNLAALWERELQIKPIGLLDNFFELGGHSLAAARIISDIQYTLGKKLTLSTFYQANTLGELAKLTKKALKVDKKASFLSETNTKVSHLLPLGHFQFMLWMARTFERKASNLNIIARRRIQGVIDIQQLESAFTAVLKRHEIFFYKILKFRPAQLIQTASAFKFSQRDLTSLSYEESYKNQPKN